MDERPSDLPETDSAADEAARIMALMHDGWWLLPTVALLLMLLHSV